MSLYQCENCGCLENTALGWYHCRSWDNVKYQKPEDQGKALCSACGPTHYNDGKPIRELGDWHNKFKRMFLPKGKFYTNKDGNLAHKDTHKTDVDKYTLDKEEGT